MNLRRITKARAATSNVPIVFVNKSIVDGTYEGWREGYAVIITVNDRPLSPRLDLYNHSPTGFEWGHAG